MTLKDLHVQCTLLESVSYSMDTDTVYISACMWVLVGSSKLNNPAEIPYWSQCRIWNLLGYVGVRLVLMT